MDATLILIDSDAALVRARALVDRLWNSNNPADVARLEAQARLIAAYEEKKWPRRPPSVAEMCIRDRAGRSDRCSAECARRRRRNSCGVRADLKPERRAHPPPTSA